MATATSILLPKQFDATKVSFGQPRLQGTGGKIIFVQYGDSRFLVQTPEMKAPFGVSFWAGENGAPDKYSLDISMDGADARPAVRAFQDMVDALDRTLIKTAMEQSNAWFKKRFANEDVVEALYTRSLKYAKDKETGEITTKFAPTLKMVLPTKDGKFDFPVYNSKREEIDLMELVHAGRTKGARVQAILQLTSVWIVGTKFGLSWKVRQLKVSEPARLTGYAFQRTEEDEEEDDVEVPAAPASAKKAAAPLQKAVGGGMLPDSDAEDDGKAGSGGELDYEDDGLDA